MEYFIKFLRTYHCEKVTASFPWRHCHKVSGKPNINYASLVELKKCPFGDISQLLAATLAPWFCLCLPS